MQIERKKLIKKSIINRKYTDGCKKVINILHYSCLLEISHHNIRLLYIVEIDWVK